MGPGRIEIKATGHRPATFCFTARQGRRPGYYAFNPTAGYSMGVDLAHGGVAVVLVDYTGKAVREREAEFQKGASADDVLAED